MKEKIGIFDSGVGGLTVLNSMQKMVPYADLVYVGDNKNCPYGDKTKEQLLEYASRVIEYFTSINIKMIVLACNTTSANVLDELRIMYPHLKLIGVIDSTVLDFISREKKSVAIVATNATISSHKYLNTIKNYNQNYEVFEIATPKLVPAIESGSYKNGMKQILSHYLANYQNSIDSIILGCTHYPIIIDDFKEVLGNIEYISSSSSVSYEVKNILETNLSLDKNAVGDVVIFTTGDVKEFVNAAKHFYDFQNNVVELLTI